MDLEQSFGGANELFEAQAHIYRHILNYINSMVLDCALELGIPDIIHNHQKPITIQELVSKLNKLFNDAMASNSEMMKLVVKENKELFEGVDSLVDVGGGNGACTKILLEAFPHLKCTVLELPHVVSDMVDTRNLKYVGGDMFHSIPSANGIILKNILHDWSDEDVLKILERCKEAITFAPSDCKKGKVIIIDMVIGDSHRHGDR